MSIRRIVMMAEMHGRDLLRRHIALGLLVLLPFSFYLASAGSGQGAVSSGGVGMAFAVSGAALFSVLSSRAADQRLILSGYRPFEMLLGRLLFLGPLALVISFAFSGAMALISEPTRPWVMVLGVGVVALQSVPVGLAVGSALPRELEGTLVLIGVIGIQLATRIDTVVSQVLPFYGPRELVEAATAHQGAIARPLLQTLFYGLALLIAARLFVSRRIDVVCHEALADTVAPRTRRIRTAAAGAPEAVRAAVARPVASAHDRWMGAPATAADPADRPGPIDVVDRSRPRVDAVNGSRQPVDVVKGSSPRVDAVNGSVDVVNGSVDVVNGSVDVVNGSRQPFEVADRQRRRPDPSPRPLPPGAETPADWRPPRHRKRAT